MPQPASELMLAFLSNEGSDKRKRCSLRACPHDDCCIAYYLKLQIQLPLPLLNHFTTDTQVGNRIIDVLVSKGF